MAPMDSSSTPPFDRILIWAVLKTLAVFGGLATVGAFFGQGPEVALGVAAGALLFGLSGCGLIYLVTRLLDPRSANKGAMGAMLATKGVGVLAAAWVIMHYVDPAGFAFGLVTGVFAVVYGAQSGQASPQGQAALEAAERAIQEMEDKKSSDSPPKNR